MNSDNVSQETAANSAAPLDPVASSTASLWRRPVVRYAVMALATAGALGSGLMWFKLSNIQEQLAKQTADSGSQAMEARLSAKQAQDLSRETAAQLAVMEAKLSEVALQRSQLEELMQSLSRSRDENLVVDIDSALRLALQQSQLTGSVQPLLAALKSAEQRLNKVAQPRLAPVLRAILRDTDRIKAAAVTDTPGLLLKVDELVRAVDDLPLLNAVGVRVKELPTPLVAQSSWARAISLSWWQRTAQELFGDMRDLVRISRVDQPDASLLAPDQSYFVRENVKLRLLNARLSLLARHFDVARSDLTQVNQDLLKYFETSSRQGQTTLTLAREVLEQAKQTELPRIDDTLTALTTAAAGR
jgi:uroporphyrin-3 C-methyltransferase